MAWQGVHISQPAKLNLKNKQLIIVQDDSEISFPIEDIAWLVLDTQQTSMTCSLLSALAENGIAMIVPDAKHHPAGILLPFHQHYAQAHIAHMQINISIALKKRLWQTLVIAKIRNQATHLKYLGKDKANELFTLADRVVSGDPDNIEARAARIYWSNLFCDFLRNNKDDYRNGLLNYGYAIIRAALARACTASGLLPAFGLQHASKSNAFNLVDDLIEPFRPFIDRLAYKRAQETESDHLTIEDRRYMTTILNENIKLGSDKTTILSASELVVTSLVRAMENNSATLLQLPD